MSHRIIPECDSLFIYLPYLPKLQTNTLHPSNPSITRPKVSSVIFSWTWASLSITKTDSSPAYLCQIRNKLLQSKSVVASILYIGFCRHSLTHSLTHSAPTSSDSFTPHLVSVYLTFSWSYTNIMNFGPHGWWINSRNITTTSHGILRLPLSLYCSTCSLHLHSSSFRIVNFHFVVCKPLLYWSERGFETRQLRTAIVRSLNNRSVAVNPFSICRWSLE